MPTAPPVAQVVHAPPGVHGAPVVFTPPAAHAPAPAQLPGASVPTALFTPPAQTPTQGAPFPVSVPRPSQPPVTSTPVPSLSQPPRPSFAPQTVPSGSVAISAEARVRELQTQVVRAKQELVTAQVDLRTARGEADNLRAELAVAKTRIEELEAALKKVQSAPPAAIGDDLKSIKGIGPKYEKMLRAAGVTGLAAIAAWSESDIDTMADKVGIKAERIRRDDWVGNAKRLTGAA
jgi:predicted flap endonuclease-1-like 5' DNA nuclease